MGFVSKVILQGCARFEIVCQKMQVLKENGNCQTVLSETVKNHNQLLRKMTFKSSMDFRNHTNEIFVNEHYRKDFLYSFGYSPYLLKLVSAWPMDRPKSRLHWMGLALGRILSVAVMSILVVPLIFHILLVKNTFTEMLVNVGIMILYLMSLVKYIFILRHFGRVSTCFEEVLVFWQQADSMSRSILLKYAKLGRFITITATDIGWFSWIIWHSFALTTPPTKVDNKTLHFLTYAAFIPFVSFSPREPPYYYYFAVGQFISDFVLYSTWASCLSLSVNAILQGVGQIEIMCKHLQSLKQDTVSDKAIVDVIKNHNHLLKYFTVVNDVFDGQFVTEWITCVSGVCITGFLYVIETGGFLELLNDVVGMLILSYLFCTLCYACDELQQQSVNIKESIYASEWYNFSHANVQNIVIIIYVSNIPRKLAAGGLIDLSMITYGNVMRKAFAFLNVLKSIA